MSQDFSHRLKLFLVFLSCVVHGFYILRVMQIKQVSLLRFLLYSHIYPSVYGVLPLSNTKIHLKKLSSLKKKKMVQIREFRIVMPISLEEYEVGVMYTIIKMEQQNTSTKEGVEILKTSPFEDEILGKGQYTMKLYHFLSKVPSWLRSLAPADAFVVQDESWNAYPRSKTVVKCPHFSKFHITIETVHKADNGCSGNVHGLSKELLAIRKVEVLDIATKTTDYWSKVVGTTDVDVSKFISQRTGRGPLSKGWKERCDPVMTAYKLITIDAPYFGFGSHVENAMLAGERALFLEYHRRCFTYTDEWFGLTVEEVCKLERDNDMQLKKIFNETSSRSDMERNEGRNQKDEMIVGNWRSKSPKIHDDNKRSLEENQAVIAQIPNRPQKVQI